MFKLIISAIIQSAFLAAAQFFMKVGMDRVVDYSMSWTFFRSFLNWQLVLAAMLYIIGMIIYMFMLKSYSLSVIYPLTSISYIFTMLLAMQFLGEKVPIAGWLGVLFIMLGVGFIGSIGK
jgi:undecaprenyl phosphate-alpha-L-ara4N flippase subunit ArnE